MTRLLLDTCVLIHWAADPTQLTDEARIAIADPTNQVFVSAVSALEITIKRQLGKLRSPPHVAKLLADNRFLELAVTVAHAEAVNALPLLHRDPFDRLLVAQAREERLRLVTRDADVLQYDVPLLAA
ncbi:MAG: type II toxin-antitoxin system VapC family toxin [Planctomycetales bacterium]|nr:type II toxin-antitoxin system VapC family toxin [Planctomycetales bacterium]